MIGHVQINEQTSWVKKKMNQNLGWVNGSLHSSARQTYTWNLWQKVYRTLYAYAVSQLLLVLKVQPLFSLEKTLQNILITLHKHSL